MVGYGGSTSVRSATRIWLEDLTRFVLVGSTKTLQSISHRLIKLPAAV
jgi:hypothetical protein